MPSIHSSQRARPRPRPGAILSLASIAAVAACAAPATTEAEPPIEEHVPIELRMPDDEPSVGKLLVDFSSAINAWTTKTWNASDGRDHQKQDRLELYLTAQAKKHKETLLIELESGPTQNRTVAAAAVGFAREPDTLSPLLNALDDPEPAVVQNAMLGLSLLQSPDTPLGQVCEILRHAADPRMRWSAAYLVRTLLEVGARDDRVAEAAHIGLTDTEPMVRTQCTLIVALLEDTERLGDLAILLHDGVPLVRAAAARGLVHLGRVSPPDKGRAARALVGAMSEAEPSERARLAQQLVLLSGHQYGLEVEAWAEWAKRLP
ncbi:MAG: HEAT repeat domain-containing protein [Planctomycetota bacterium]|nr:HEAT repeat domain-containing protein [Planctomycetota bacterium]